MATDAPELLTVHSPEGAEQPYRYSAGRYVSRFLAEMRDRKRILGVRCPRCGKVYAPPKEVCDPCFAVMTEPVEVGPRGELKNFTVMRFAFVDPETGESKPVPYTFGNVQLDGADTILASYIEFADASDLRVGARVETVFREERTGSMRDIRCFRVVGS